jgi:hypothetical protein
MVKKSNPFNYMSLI